MDNYSIIHYDDTNVKIFNYAPYSMFGMTSVLLYNDTDCFLVDTQFENMYSDKIAEFILINNLNLNFIFITFHEPEYYFGIHSLLKRFPKTEVYAMPATVDMIQSMYKTHIAMWSKFVPSKIILPNVFESNAFYFQGLRFDIATYEKYYNTITCSELHLLIGGELLVNNIHLPRIPREINKRLKLIYQIDYSSVRENVIIPAHFAGSPRVNCSNRSVFNFMKGYLQNFAYYSGKYKKASDIRHHMISSFPDQYYKSNLVFTTRHFGIIDIINDDDDNNEDGSYGSDDSGNIKFPPIGKVMSTIEGAVKIEFYTDSKMGVKVRGNSFSSTVDYKSASIGDNIFMLWWVDPKTNSKVTSVQNWNTLEAWTNVSFHKGATERHLKHLFCISSKHK